MIEGVKELNRDIKMSIGAIIFTSITLVMTTFSLTTIYNQFLLQDELIRETNKEINRVEGRLEKITGRSKDTVHGLDERIKILELLNSDK